MLGALNRGDDDQLLGTPEAQWIDFKGAPHILSSDRGKWELAKDVVALANAGGGALVIGVQTRVPDDEFTEIADVIKPFPRSMIDESQVRKIIAASCHPRPEGIVCHSFNRGDGDTHRLFVLAVPAQHEDRGPFLTTRILDDQGRLVAAIAMPVRDGSDTQWESVGVLWRDIADGRRSRRQPPPVVHTELPIHVQRADRLKARLEEIDDLMDWTDTPVYSLAALPLSPGIELAAFYDRPGVRADVEHIESLRGGVGFGIGWGTSLEIRDGSIETHDATRRCLWIDPDGFTVAACAGTGALLAWGLDHTILPTPTTEPVAINPTVLAEYTLEFCRFVYATILPRSKSNGWVLSVTARRFREVPRPVYFLVPGAQNTGQSFRPSADEWSREITFVQDEAHAAYALLREFLKLYARPEDDIPLAVDKRIDIERIKALR